MMRIQRIEEKIRQSFQSIVELKIEDESHKHSGRKGTESHFKLFLVTPDLTGKNRVERHRLVNQLLLEEFNNGLHALSLRLLTPEEFKKQKENFKTPNCQKS